MIVSRQQRATRQPSVTHLREAESFSLLDIIYQILDATVDGEVKCEEVCSVNAQRCCTAQS